ncbi:DUF6492 family protein [Roseicella aquatilis]|uniref:Uncharacterized protein n=1 Tax=Roseicella aquatilis TaxID=2527868 RepID=A0A4V2WKJ2_9PROT|nr:DUF6492 family protein [Roseicella aquatilis]TCZ58754.1 hypothetical protein EXY23_16210 [Roseicella aquatilis]
MDLVTVVYGKELPQLAVQAKSIEKYLDPEKIGNIFVVINDEKEEECFDTFYSKIIKNYGSKQGLVRPLGVSMFANGALISVPGYISQQALKLLSAEFCTSDHYLALDAKNFFIRTTSKADFFAEDGTPYCKYGLFEGAKHKILQNYYDLFRVADNRRTNKLPAMMTPFVLYRNHVLNLPPYVELFSKTDFLKTFLFDVKPQSEFLLYVTYLISLGVDPNTIYREVRSLSTTLWPSMASGRPALENHFKYAIANRVPMFGLHRGRALNMSPDEQQSFHQFLVELDLASDDEPRFWMPLP